MDYTFFWKKIQEEYGAISLHLRNILKIQNLCNKSLSNLNRESVKAIAKDMREMAEYLTEAAASGGTPLCDIYGPRWEKNPKDFTFLEGEILCLVELAQVIKSNGIATFLKFSKPQSVVVLPTPPLMPHRLQKTQDPQYDAFRINIVEQIKHTYNSQNIRDPEYEGFLAKLNNLDANLFRCNEGQLRAAIICPVCEYDGQETKITLRAPYNPLGKWHIYSFARHCDNFHYALPRTSRKKRCSEGGEEAEETAEDTAPDTTAVKMETEGATKN